MALSDFRIPLRFACAAFAGILLSGCATTNEYRDDFDPWEDFNRDMLAFNESLDNHVLKPVATGYQDITPDFVDKGLTNFFSNIDDVKVFFNDLFQFKLGEAGTDLGRVAINSTAGILGFVDVATDIGLEKNDEDFGQTLGAYGVDAGPYIMLPLFGPSTGRDLFGRIVDTFLDPLNYVDPTRDQLALKATDVVDFRADNLNTTDVLEQAALDRYIFIRDAYLQRREFLIHDGNPPLEDPELEEEEGLL